MGIIELYYRWTHPNVPKDKIPDRVKISVWQGIKKILRKYLSAVVIPTIPFNNLRVSCYRMIGYKIGRGTFIGMRCYLDDLAYDEIEIGNNVTISYGVFFACHGWRQSYHKIIIKNGVYVGMRCSIIAPKSDVIIGEKAFIGAHSLVNRSIPEGVTAVGVPCRVLEKEKNEIK